MIDVFKKLLLRTRLKDVAERSSLFDHAVPAQNKNDVRAWTTSLPTLVPHNELPSVAVYCLCKAKKSSFDVRCSAFYRGLLSSSPVGKRHEANPERLVRTIRCLKWSYCSELGIEQN